MEIIQDALYSQLIATPDDWRLYQTPQLTRLRQLSLSAVPPWLKATSTCATKFEHTIGVGHLAKIVGERPEFESIAQNLYFAALAHDLGTPPFSHISEIYQHLVLGKNHEQFVVDIIDNSAFSKEVRRQGGDISEVLSFVLGEKPPLSDLVNGTIDIDNLDNSLRFGASLGLFRNLPYSPEKLAANYRFINGQLGFAAGSESLLEKWTNCRQVVYQHAYSESNTRSWAMLVRAIGFAHEAGQIKRDYFLMTDAEAFLYLRDQTNPQTSWLIRRLESWQFHRLAYELTITNPKKELAEMHESDHSRIRVELADTIAAALKLKPEAVGIFAARNKGHREIHLPVFDLNGQPNIAVKTNPSFPLTWHLKVYVASGVVKNEKEIIEEVLKTSQLQ